MSVSIHRATHKRHAQIHKVHLHVPVMWDGRVMALPVLILMSVLTHRVVQMQSVLTLKVKLAK